MKVLQYHSAKMLTGNKLIPSIEQPLPELVLPDQERIPRYRIWRRFTVLHLFALMVAIVVVLPLVYRVIRATSAGQGAITYLFDPRTLMVIGNSIALTAAVVTASTIIGVIFAWLVTRTKLPLRRMWLVLGLL